MSKLERMSNEAVASLPSAASKLIVAATKSAEEARKTRARVRRQRMNSQTTFQAVKISAPKARAFLEAADAEAAPPEEPLEMPRKWREDEPTIQTKNEK